MTEPEEVKPRRRRTRQEVERFVSEFVASGLPRGEFCRMHGLTFGTLERGLNREPVAHYSVESIESLAHVKLALAIPDLEGPRFGSSFLDIARTEAAQECKKFIHEVLNELVKLPECAEPDRAERLEEEG